MTSRGEFYRVTYSGSGDGTEGVTACPSARQRLPAAVIKASTSEGTNADAGLPVP